MSASVHRLKLASVKLPGRYNPPTYLDSRISVYAYLVITSSDIILIDTGVGEGSEFINTRFEPHRTPIADELAQFGLATIDVNVVVNSHLHFDHCGNNSTFPHAEVFVQKKELEIARATQYTVQQWFDFEGALLHAVSGDTEIIPGIQLLSTPGHTPGHQSVLIETEDGNLLVAAQAAYTAEEYRHGGNPTEQAHDGLGEKYLQSISQLKSVGAREVYFSHDDQAVT